MCLVTVPAAWALLLPFEFTAHFKALGSVALFVSNIYFADQSGYFAPEAASQALLHTWSLGVEEQFYLLYPLILLPLLRLGSRGLVAGLVALATVSFALSVWGSLNETDKNFFFTPSRFWELLAGALCALAPKGWSARSNDGLAALGLALIGIALVMLGPDKPSPSAWTLMPVAGTVSVILFAGQGGLVARALSWGPLVGIGLVSYSAYLWHQPVLAFARLGLDRPPGLALRCGLVVLVFLLAAATWALVERPFRRRGPGALLPRRAQALTASLIGLGLLFGIGLWGWKSDGAMSRYSPATQEMLRDYGDFRRTMGPFDLGRCFADLDQGPEGPLAAGCLARHRPGDLVLWGDSMAAHLVQGLRQVQGHGVTQFTAASCRPYSASDASERCQAMRETFRDANGLAPAVLVLSANWLGTVEQEGAAAMIAALRSELAWLRGAGYSVIVVGQTPDFPTHSWVRKLARLDTVPERMWAEARRHDPLNEALSKAALAEGAGFLDPGPVLCQSAGTWSDCLAVEGGRPVWADAGHLSADGSILIAKALKVAGLLAE